MSELTPSQQRQAQLARLKAKQKVRQAAEQVKSQKARTATTAGYVSLVNTTPAQPSSSRNAAVAVPEKEVPLPRDSSLGKYFDYDLSKLHNSKGGFLTEEDDGSRNGLKTLAQIQREKARERTAIKEGEEPGEFFYFLFFVRFPRTMWFVHSW